MSFSTVTKKLYW